jgi:hypothetical protein
MCEAATVCEVKGFALGGLGRGVHQDDLLARASQLKRVGGVGADPSGASDYADLALHEPASGGVCPVSPPAGGTSLLSSWKA